MPLAWLCTLGSRAGSAVSRVAVVECAAAAAAGAGGCVKGGLEWTLGGVRGFRSAAVGMAPIKVTVGPARPDLFAAPPAPRLFAQAPSSRLSGGESPSFLPSGPLPAALEAPPAVCPPSSLHQDPVAATLSPVLGALCPIYWDSQGFWAFPSSPFRIHLGTPVLSLHHFQEID